MISVLVTGIPLLGIHQGTSNFWDSSTSQNELLPNSERLLNVEPTNQSDIAADGHGDIPKGHTTMANKVIGKIRRRILSFFSCPWEVLESSLSLEGSMHLMIKYHLTASLC